MVQVVAEQGPSPSPRPLAFSCSVFLEERRKEGALLTGLGKLTVPGDASVQEPHPSLQIPPMDLEPAHMVAVSGPRWLGSPELWETPCCFSPRLFPWLRSN